MKRITQTLTATLATVCAGVVLVGAPAQAARVRHGKAAADPVQVQIKQNTVDFNGQKCVTFERHRANASAPWSVWVIVAATDGPCGTVIFP